MLDKIKEVLGVAEKIKEVSAAVEVHNQKVQQLQDQLNRLQEIIVSMSTAQSKSLTEVQHVLDQTRQSMEAVDGVKKKLEEEVHQFRMLKGQLQSKLIDRFDQELKAELSRNTEDLHLHAEHYTKIRDDINRFTSTLSHTSDEIQKWLLISKAIKEKDFDMTRTSRQLIDLGSEKRVLLDKIDMLEKLVGKMRRRQ